MAAKKGDWIKLYRTLLDKGWSNRPDYVAMWTHILLAANHREKEYFWNGKTIKLQPGQFITGRKSLSEKTGIHESKVERILNVFESEQQIEQRKTSTSRLISILNWGEFQKREQPFEQRVNNERTTDEQPVNTKQEYKEYKEGKNVVGQPQPPQNHPSKSEFTEYCATTLHLPKSETERIWTYYQASLQPESDHPKVWRTKRGKPIANWRQHLASVWLKDKTPEHNESRTTKNVRGWAKTTAG